MLKQTTLVTRYPKFFSTTKEPDSEAAGSERSNSQCPESSKGVSKLVWHAVDLRNDQSAAFVGSNNKKEHPARKPDDSIGSVKPSGSSAVGK